ncbi:MAG: hypothetical protein WBE26_06815 [Phycisphaerae bacterium]
MRVVAVVVLVPTPDPDIPYPGAEPPASVGEVSKDTPFYAEIWASNVLGDRPGLACVTEDVHYTTSLLDAVPPVEDGPLFPIRPVEPVFAGPAGLVDDVSGCQGAPPTDFLGVDEWVMVDRIEMTCVEAGTACVELADAGNIFAGVSLIGDPNNVDPSQVSFESWCFECTECGDCPFDVNINGVIDTGDYAFFLSCFATLVNPGDSCYCLDVNGNGGIDTGDYAAFLSCFAEYCPCPTMRGTASVPSVDVRLVVTETPSLLDAADELPARVTQMTSGKPFYVEVWASVSGGAGGEAACVFADMEFDGDMLAVFDVQPAVRFSRLTAARTDERRGRLVNLGGCIAPDATPQGGQWGRVAVIKMTGGRRGNTTLRLTNSSGPFHGISVVGVKEQLRAPTMELDKAELHFEMAPVDGEKRGERTSSRR